MAKSSATILFLFILINVNYDGDVELKIGKRGADHG